MILVLYGHPERCQIPSCRIFSTALGKNIRAKSSKVIRMIVECPIMGVAGSCTSGRASWEAAKTSILYPAIFVGGAVGSDAGHDPTLSAGAFLGTCTPEISALANSIVDSIVIASALGDGDALTPTENKSVITRTTFCAISITTFWGGKTITGDRTRVSADLITAVSRTGEGTEALAPPWMHGPSRLLTRHNI